MKLLVFINLQDSRYMGQTFCQLVWRFRPLSKILRDD